jgi:thiol-disulfide isomerase/thioredoxin
MDCLRCGKPVTGSKALCEECLAAGRQYAIEKLDPQAEVEEANPGSTNFAMRLAVLLLVILAGIFISWFLGKPAFMPQVKLPSTGEAYGILSDPCTGKKRCLIIYVATWCPACHASIPFIQGLQKDLENNPEVGFKIIVGGGAGEEQLYGMARQIQGNVFLDSQGQFHRRVRIGSVPHWWLIDDQGQILRNFSGAFGSYSPELRDMFFQKELGEDAEFFARAG